ncbi:MAG: hypothetical protein O2895_00955 [Chloroflexi bacterium]|nr:hypothetical protein [Chloroflexota bacterium]
MQQARAYMAQIADLSHPSPGRRMHEIREMLSPAEAYAAQDTVRPAPLPPAVPAGPGRAAPARPVSAEERASAQLRLRVEGWLSEAELALRRIDANTLDRLQTEDRQVIEDLIDRVRARLLFLVSGRRYPD